MPFEKGKTGNPNGRPKGTPNKATKAVREVLEGFFNQYFANGFDDDFEQLEPKEKIDALAKLLPYFAPKYTETTVHNGIELSEAERQKLIQKIIQSETNEPRND